MCTQVWCAGRIAENVFLIHGHENAKESNTPLFDYFQTKF